MLVRKLRCCQLGMMREGKHLSVCHLNFVKAGMHSTTLTCLYGARVQFVGLAIPNFMVAVAQNPFEVGKD